MGGFNNPDVRSMLREDVFPTPFCPGCGHGILLQLILRGIKRQDIPMDKMVFCSGIGCAGWIPSPHYAADTMHVLHGRPVACATGIKLFRPELNVMVISGDGDIASIGGNHLIHAARRNVPMTVVCANNFVYGMTGGQAAPTTPPGDRTSTTPLGNQEKPFDLSRLVEAAGATYVCRYHVGQAQPIIRAIGKALTCRGFAFIEVLSPCPTEYGRRNQLGTTLDMLKILKSRCVSKARAKDMSPEELEGKLITGEIVPLKK
ncbi:thiamine pyrophosphate-dependent enzyme [Acidobacteriota bacterium]